MFSEQHVGGGGAAQIHEVRWETDMHGPITRKLVNETHSMSYISQPALSFLL